MLERLKNEWFASSIYRNYAVRDAGEKRIILAVALLVLGVAVWSAVWQPISGWSQSAQSKHERQLALLDWMKQNEADARRIGMPDGAAQAGEGGLLTVVSRTVEQAGLKLSRIQPERDGVSVVLQKQAFNDVLRWLDTLEEREGILVVQASVDADALSGRVNARFSLRR
ncbi:MAG: type II secretion system protein M [Pseudomonadota bacterium]